KVGEGLEKHAAIWRIVGRSISFGLLLMLFHIVEEGIRGWFHGRSFIDSMIEISGGKFLEIGTLAVITMVPLMPYFFLREISSAFGRAKLREVLFGTSASTPSTTD